MLFLVSQTSLELCALTAGHQPELREADRTATRAARAHPWVPFRGSVVAASPHSPSPTV